MTGRGADNDCQDSKLDKQKRYDEKNNEMGIVKVAVRVPRQYRDQLLAIAEEARRKHIDAQLLARDGGNDQEE
jgi:hypothetical protein